MGFQPKRKKMLSLAFSKEHLSRLIDNSVRSGSPRGGSFMHPAASPRIQGRSGRSGAPTSYYESSGYSKIENLPKMLRNPFSQ